MKTRPVAAELFHADGRRDGRNLKLYLISAISRRLTTGVSLRRPEFDTRPVHVLLLVDKWKWDRLLSHYFRFPCQFHSTNAPYSLIHVTEAI
jgi:hypothetical protein